MGGVEVLIGNATYGSGFFLETRYDITQLSSGERLSLIGPKYVTQFF